MLGTGTRAGKQQGNMTFRHFSRKAQRNQNASRGPGIQFTWFRHVDVEATRTIGPTSRTFEVCVKGLNVQLEILGSVCLRWPIFNRAEANKYV